jgi:hypothetical protein
MGWLMATAMNVLMVDGDSNECVNGCGESKETHATTAMVDGDCVNGCQQLR